LFVKQIVLEGLLPNDVADGRGAATNQHVGNVRFRRLIAEHGHLYGSIKDGRKHLLAEEMVSKVHSTGGRFLKKDNKSGAWVEISRERAKKKAQVLLRAYTVDERGRHGCSSPSTTKTVVTPPPVTLERPQKVAGTFLRLPSPPLLILSPLSIPVETHPSLLSSLENGSTFVHRIPTSPAVSQSVIDNPLPTTLNLPEGELDNSYIFDDGSVDPSLDIFDGGSVEFSLDDHDDGSVDPCLDDLVELFIELPKLLLD
jgi:hypothetical protein